MAPLAESDGPRGSRRAPSSVLSRRGACAKLTPMSCPLCQQRPGRRQCPALGQVICSVCCGTKRQIEIHCPSDCGYLAAAHVHPPASVRRQQERDLGFVMAMRDGLTESQADLFLALLSFVAGLQADPLVKIHDDDVADGTGALAATYETANRGLIYEHQPQSLLAQRFVTDAKAFLASMVTEADAATTRRIERDAAVVLRHLETGVRGARKVADEGPATALGMVGRFIAAARSGRGLDGGSGESRVEPPQPLLIRP
jgi:hypothetical protein